MMTKPMSAPSDDITEHVVGEITKRFSAAQRPIVIVDACAGRFGMASTVRKLVEGCGVRFFESKFSIHMTE
jgi:pyruvate decarboxylase